MTVTCQLRVIYGDTDQMGVAYYGNYLRWMEAGRNEYCRAREIPYRQMEEDGYYLPVVEVGVKYRQPARYDDLIEIHTTVDQVGRSKVDFSYDIVRVDDGEVLARAHTVHACIRHDGKLVRLPDMVRSILVQATRKEED